MAFDYVLKITDNASGTVTLTSSPFGIRRYRPRVGADTQETIAETIESLRVDDGSVANNLAELRTLQALLRQAKQAQNNRSLDKVYLVWKENASADEYRSEIVDGRAEWDETALQYGYWENDVQFADLFFERVNYWEGPEAQISLTNTGGTANTSGLTVYNHNDSTSGHDNYVEIPGTAVLGDLPGATRLEMVNAYNSDRDLYDIWIGQNFTDPSNFQHIYEAEDAASTTDTAGTAESGGYYVSGTVSLADTETDLLVWTLTSAQLDAAAGRFYKALVRFHDSGGITTCRFRLAIKVGTTTVWQSGQVTPDSSRALLIRDLLAFRLPPWLPGLTSLKELTLTLTAEASSVPQVVDIDFLQLTPVDGWRYLVPAAQGAAYQERVIDDGIEDRLYIDNGSGSALIGTYVGYGHPIMLEPGKDQRLYWLMHTNYANECYIDQALTVKLHYRPRRRSL